MANVLLLGSGAREHAIAWKLSQSARVAHVYVSPGNAGTQQEIAKVSNVDLNLQDIDAVSSWCAGHDVKLVVIGPEDPLANGIVDELSSKGHVCFGPTAKAAQIEASKAYAKSVMEANGTPTARWSSFTDAEEACRFINSATYPALVVKASGLAAGKGVVVAKSKDEACQAVREMLVTKQFGEAGETVVVEELLEGDEVSVLCFTDGKTIACLPSAQDHKRLSDGDAGPNTGGMGACAPCSWLAAADRGKMAAILQKTVDSLAELGAPFRGVLYGGFMLTADGPKVLEFNCRLGDPETQVLLPLMTSDLFSTMLACASGTLAKNMPEFDSGASAVGVVLASEGYPGPYTKGVAISGLSEAERLGCHVFHAGTRRDGSGQLVTSGGRVLTVTAVGRSLTEAATRAQAACKAIECAGAMHRKDIAHKALSKIGSRGAAAGLTYADAGVDIAAGDRLVDAIKPLAAATARPGCSAELGLFGSVFDLKVAAFKDPLLVSGTDGVGTKLKVAQACGLHSTVGIDLVAMCVNDVLAHGAEPLFFLDYFASGKLDVSVAREVVRGVAEGCKLAGCSLAGGETAEMPGMYADGEYDVAGFAVGAVERVLYLPRVNDVAAGDVVIGLPSSGVHSNGFSLVRRIVERSGHSLSGPCPFDARAASLGEALLTPTTIYVKTLLPLLRSGYVKALAHITGGGLPENLPRVLPRGVDAHLDASVWRMPPVFGWLQREGQVEASEMSLTFNCGIGVALIVSAAYVQPVAAMLKDAGQEEHYVIGKLVRNGEGEAKVNIVNMAEALTKSYSPVAAPPNGGPLPSSKRVGVLISGSGTNLQALIDHTADKRNGSAAEIVLVISNVADVEGLRRAQAAGIPTRVISHKGYKGREDYDAVVTATLDAAGVEIVCLAGFMRIVSGTFVRRWQGNLLNIHPSLLPSFRGINAHEQALNAGVKVTGCTVHFVEEEVDAGAILVQEAVHVVPGDTVATLSERVKVAEHKAYPKALHMLARGDVRLGTDGKLVYKH